jgi:hypothetical protein
MTIDLTALRIATPWTNADDPDWEGRELGSFFTYDDRGSYLAWVREWKTEYATLSARIRAQKRERCELQRAGAYDVLAARPLREDRRLARGMLALRRAAKRDSWTKRNASNVA